MIVRAKPGAQGATARYEAPKVVFVHIMKTAGTTISNWVERHYGRSDVLTGAAVWPEFLQFPLSVVLQKRFIRGHFGNYITKILPPPHYRYMTLLRNPAERALSHYFHFKRVADDVRHELVKNDDFTLDDYMTHPLTRSFAANFQVANLSLLYDWDPAGLQGDITSGRALDDGALDRAKAFLEAVEVIGFQDELGGFVDSASAAFGYYPDHSLRKSRDYRPDDYHPSRQVLRRLEEINDLDFALYDWAKRLQGARGRWKFAGRSAVNPIDLVADPVRRWLPTEPFFGSGWWAVHWAEKGETAHRWSDSADASITVRSRPGAGYVMTIEVFRFVLDTDAANFSLLIDGVRVPLVEPSQATRCEAGGGIYAAEFQAGDTGETVITFHMAELRTFASVYPDSNETTPRGLALAGMTIVERSDDRDTRRSEGSLPAVRPRARGLIDSTLLRLGFSASTSEVAEGQQTRADSLQVSLEAAEAELRSLRGALVRANIELDTFRQFRAGPSSVARKVLQDIARNRLDVGPALFAAFRNVRIGAQLRAAISSAEWLHRNADRAPVYVRRNEMLEALFPLIPAEGDLAEFGVYLGATTIFVRPRFADRRYHAFDSWRGVPEAMSLRRTKFFFDLDGVVPKLPPDTTIHSGWFHETIPKWREQFDAPIAFAYIDCDLYESVCTVLEGLTDRVRAGTILVFDSWYNYPNWEEHAPKASQEWTQRHGIRMEPMGTTTMDHAVAFRIGG
jgi:hypothetical protein